MKRKIVLMFITVMSFPIIGLAQDRADNAEEQIMHARMGDVKSDTYFDKLVDETALVYSAIAKGKQGEVPAIVLSKARCIAILPDVKTGALVIGGTHGEGLASCKTSDNTWSQPVPTSINQGSIGLQAGVKSVDLVLFFQDEKAEMALKRGEFELGTDVSVVAGRFDSNIDTSNAGVVVYSRAKGLFAGASINGSKIGKDQDKIIQCYGKSADYAALLESPQDSGYATKLTKLFP